MSEPLQIETITPDALVARAGQLRREGCRLVQIGATRFPEQVELTYSFDLEGQLRNLRLVLPSAEARVPSISSAFWAAFLYENEIHDLFNVQVDGLAVDFHGALYRTTINFPFGSTKVPTTKTASSTPGPAPKSPAAGATLQ